MGTIVNVTEQQKTLQEDIAKLLHKFKAVAGYCCIALPLTPNKTILTLYYGNDRRRSCTVTIPKKRKKIPIFMNNKECTEKITETGIYGEPLILMLKPGIGELMQYTLQEDKSLQRA